MAQSFLISAKIKKYAILSFRSSTPFNKSIILSRIHTLSSEIP